jgi:hypothetical protein
VPEIEVESSFMDLMLLKRKHLLVSSSNVKPLTLFLDIAIFEQPPTDAYFFEVLTANILPSML